jgi:hypothetical protein
MASDNYDEKYTKPELRRRLKDEIKSGDKGGEPGQWSARKSQLLVQRYEKEGGGYKSDDKHAAARSLKDWQEQSWQTRDGSGRADRKDGMHRYLPQNAWALLLQKDQDEAEQTKSEADDRDEQFSDWPKAVQDVMTYLGYVEGSDENDITKDYLYNRAQELDIDGRSSMNKDELKTAIIEAYEPSA